MYAAALLTVLVVAMATTRSGSVPEAAGERNYQLNVPFEQNEDSPPRHYPLKVIPAGWKDSLKRQNVLNEQERDDVAHEQIAIATVIAAADLTISLLTAITNALGGIERKIAIGISNETPTVWTKPEVYYFSGTSDVIAPYEVKPGKAMTYAARKTSGPVARGVVGVIGYRMNDGNTLVVMFSVPFDYNLYENYWNARVYPGPVPIGYKLYEDQYYLIQPFKGDNRYYEKDLGQGYRVRGVMNSSGAATLEIHVEK